MPRCEGGRRSQFDKDGNCLSIEEKPQNPKSNYAVVGLYFYPNKVVHVAENIQPSARGEYEITRACPERSRRVNQWFLRDGELKVQTLGRGFAWLDTGTHDSLSEASTFVEVIENRWSSESRGKAVGELVPEFIEGVDPCFDYAESRQRKRRVAA